MSAMPSYGDSSKQAIARRLEALRLAISERLAQAEDNPDLELSQAEFARYIGFTPQALNNYMKARAGNRIQLDQAISLVARTGITLDWLYLGNPAGLPMNLSRVTELEPEAPVKTSRGR